MHLRLSEDELATLIDMVSLAAEISSLNQKPGTEEHLAGFEALEDKILEKAKHQGFDKIIEIDPERDKHRITTDYQNGSYIQDCIDEMRNEIFWDELSFRLGERDIIKRIGEARYLKLPEEERAKLIEPLQRAYWVQFSRKGIQDIHLISSRDEG